MGKIRESKIDYWKTEDGLLLLQCWKRDGMSNTAVADRMGIQYSTLKRWKNECPEIAEALNTSKELVDYMVENALLKRALGFTTKEIKVTLGKKIVSGETFEVLKETTKKEIIPDVTACLAWLNNRKHEQWKRNRDKVVELSEDDKDVKITIIRGNPKSDGLGEDVNESVSVGPKNDSETDSAEDEWPEDWEDEDEEV